MTFTTNTSFQTLNEQVAEKIALDVDRETFKEYILEILNEAYGQTNITIVDSNE